MGLINSICDPEDQAHAVLCNQFPLLHTRSQQRDALKLGVIGLADLLERKGYFPALGIHENHILIFAQQEQGEWQRPAASQYTGMGIVRDIGPLPLDRHDAVNDKVNFIQAI